MTESAAMSVSPRAMMSILGPCIGVVSGIVFGLFALLATWLVGRGGQARCRELTRQERRQMAQARGGIAQPRRQRLERRGPVGRRSSLPITCLQAENSKRDRAGTESVSRLLASSFGRAQGAACVRIASPRRGSALASTLLLQEARVGSHLPRPPPHHSTTTVMGFHPDPNSGENACFRFACLRYSRPWRGSR